MTQQTIAFEVPHNGTATSIAAAKAVSSTAASQRARILATLEANRWGLTCDELEQRLRLRHQTCSARLCELLKGGGVFHHGERTTRSGCKARVYFVKPA